VVSAGLPSASADSRTAGRAGSDRPACRFELFEMLRKLLLISVLAVVQEDAASYLWAAFLVSYFAQVLFAYYKPYAEPSLDSLQTLSLTVTCLTMFIGIMLQNSYGGDVDPNERSVQVRERIRFGP
jgi:hypothetical protein